MPTDLEVHEHYRIIGKHKHANSDYFYLAWGPERVAAAAENEGVFSSRRRQANVGCYEKAAGTFNEDLAKTGSLRPHGY